MAIIPSSTQFIGISPSVNLTEKKSNQLNAETQPYTMQDIIDTASSPPAGTTGQIQFNGGSAFAADSNLFWDNTNKYLGVGTATPGTKITAQTTTAADGISLKDATNSLALLGKWFDSSGFIDLNQSGTPYTRIQASQSYINTPLTIGTATAISARLAVKGSGSTSATTSLLVQNSSGTELLKVRDDGIIDFSQDCTVNGSNVVALKLKDTLNNKTLTFYKNAVSNYIIDSDSSTSLSYGWAANYFWRLNGLTKSMVMSSTTSDPTTDISAIVDLQSTTKGFLPPRLTTTQKNAISTPAAGLQVYDTTLNQMSYYNGSAWINF